MATVLVVGRVTDRSHLRTGFPELRTATFVYALRGAGHEVRVAGLVPPDALEQGAGIQGAVLIAEEGPGWLDAVASAAQGADLLVGAGPHNASRAACLVAGQRPVFADVPGDPFAEVQVAALSQDRPQPQR
ncbi:MAG: hypothetical protein GXP62_14550, partial [Oligoflexia bacterium]|nr:hypothetical protein [Oligoflexia bacterium]